MIMLLVGLVTIITLAQIAINTSDAAKSLKRIEKHLLDQDSN